MVLEQPVVLEQAVVGQQAMAPQGEQVALVPVVAAVVRQEHLGIVETKVALVLPVALGVEV